MLKLILSAVSCVLWANEPGITVSPSHPSNGGVALLKIADAAARSELSLTQDGKPIGFFECGKKEPKSACAFLSFPFEEEVKTSKVDLSWKQSESVRTHTLTVQLKPKSFPITKLRVDPSKVNPTAEDQIRIETEKKEILEAFTHSSAVPLWEGRFKRPAKGGETSPYGQKRMFNNEVKGVHYGLDLRAVEGTPIYATNSGTVVLAKELFYAGNLVVLDHGLNLFSSYAHLSKIEVKVGDKVKAGARIGLSGSSGRVTGPHLHWTIRVHGLNVDPKEFLQVSSKAFR